MPKFQRRHYESVAAVIRLALERSDSPLFDLAYQSTVASMFADVFEQDNPRFSRERFLAATGVSQ